MSIAQKLVDQIMVLCARHCCVCRRYRPLNLHVHHIEEQAVGGDDSEDNLIATCANCHAEVHTTTKLTRRFTSNELKLQRDAVYKLVADGKLPAVAGESSVDNADVIANSVALSLRRDKSDRLPPESNLSGEAVEILVAAARSDGMIEVGSTAEDYNCVLVGGREFGIVALCAA